MSAVSLSAPESFTAYAGLAAGISKVQLIDSTPDTYTVVVSAGTGTLSTENAAMAASVSGSGSSSVTITGSFQQVAPVLASLDYTGAASGHDTVTVTATDQTDHSSAATSIDATVRPATIFSGIDGPPAANGGTTANGINNAGQIAGSYTTSAGVPHGFLYIGGNYTTIDDGPRSVTPQGIKRSRIFRRNQ